VRPSAAPLSNDAGARFFLDGDQMIVALGTVPNERMFVVDAAGQQTYFTARYYDEHAEEFERQKAELSSIGSAHGSPVQPVYLAETLPLEIGAATVHVHYIRVLTQALGSAALDDVYGTLGVDVLDQLRSYTFDYQSMRFSVGAEDSGQ